MTAKQGSMGQYWSRASSGRATKLLCWNSGLLRSDGGKSLRHVVVPCETLFVGQRPEHAQTRRAQAEAGRRVANRALASIDRRAVEVDQPQAGPALARCFRSGQNPQESVEQRDRKESAAEPETHAGVDPFKLPATGVEGEQKHADRYSDHAEIQSESDC